MIPVAAFRAAELGLGAIPVAVLGVTLFEDLRFRIGARRAATVASAAMFCAGVLAAALFP